MKLCQDCKHLRQNPDWSSEKFRNSHATCALTAVVVETDGIECKDRRRKWWDKCGPMARQFEPKDTQS